MLLILQSRNLIIFLLTAQGKKQTYSDFVFNTSQLDVFFMLFLKDNNCYKNLTKIIKIMMALSHGHSKVEHGSNINENALVDNMQMETIVAQRRSND